MTDSAHTEAMDPKPAEVDDLCRLFLSSLPVSGVSVAVMTASGVRMTLCSSGVIAARIDELQFELGEGPQSSVVRSGQIVMIPDVASGGHDDWPVLGAALGELAVGAIFCVPIQMGAVTVGVATLYSDRPLTLDHHQQATALAIASAIAGGAVQQAMVSAIDEVAVESAAAPVLRREVHQATGIVLVQLDTTATVAYARLQAYAFANGITVLTVARDVVAGSLSFEETPS
ncbi:MAG: GAF and ANTAR domain-containing protein [Kineosporiaceae bacterium]|nr:GAF and ANTAR domain-containing protein [Aeromicrobium sp.]